MQDGVLIYNNSHSKSITRKDPRTLMPTFTLFELVYGRKATLLIEQVILSYPTETINEENFKATLYRRTYQLMEMLEGNQRTTADNINHTQEQQKERHNNCLPEQPMEFKIKDQVLLHHTKVEKQWSRKFDSKWDSSFYIHETLGNEAYKLQLENKILKKVAHRNWLKMYHAKQESLSSVS
ncbi:hypothetical protein G9A89_014078 [Geosiphon pyriformis]|nr:hypothetical protein G9A89_014078 [Geosiphon pyriformis]